VTVEFDEDLHTFVVIDDEKYPDSVEIRAKHKDANDTKFFVLFQANCESDSFTGVIVDYENFSFLYAFSATLIANKDALTGYSYQITKIELTQSLLSYFKEQRKTLLKTWGIWEKWQASHKETTTVTTITTIVNHTHHATNHTQVHEDHNHVGPIVIKNETQIILPHEKEEETNITVEHGSDVHIIAPHINKTEVETHFNVTHEHLHDLNCSNATNQTEVTITNYTQPDGTVVVVKKTTVTHNKTGVSPS